MCVVDIKVTDPPADSVACRSWSAERHGKLGKVGKIGASLEALTPEGGVKISKLQGSVAARGGVACSVT
jgi:hypothetical protein